MIDELKFVDPLTYVVENSSYVAINKQAIDKFVRNFIDKKPTHWRTLCPFPYNRRKKAEDELDFLFLIGSQAFCFWGYPKKWTIEYHGKKLDGWWALIACFEKAYEVGIPILDGNYLQELTVEKTRELFLGEPAIPLLNKRHQILTKIGEKLVKQYGGRFHNCFKSLKQDAFSILEAIIQFEGFNDIATYKGKKIYFYKKAQVVISDINESFNKRGFGNIANMDKLTGHADYKIPATLRKIGILIYRKKLAQKVNNRIYIQSGSEMEIEIRANMLWAIHLIVERLKLKHPTINPVALCGILWGMSQKKDNSDKPYHLTKTVYY